MSTLPISTSELTQEVQVTVGKDGVGAAEPETVMQAFDRTVKTMGGKPALHYKDLKKGGKAQDTPWTTLTWKDYRDKVDAFAKALMTLEFEKFDAVNIIGFNSPAWFISNFGAIAAGGVPAGIYATNLPPACKYITENSNAKVVVCEGVHQLEKYYEISSELPSLKALVMYGPDDIPSDIESKCSVPVYKFDDFLGLGKDVSDGDLKARSDSWKPGEICTLIYTSGTTGPPKAVMITNDNITWTVKSMTMTAPGGKITNNDVMVTFLPLSHIAAQMLDMHNAMQNGTQVYFAQPDALKGSLVTTLKEARPTLFFGVPRVWEKIYDKLQEIGKTITGFKKKMSTWAKKNAEAHWKSLEHGSTTSSPMMYFLAKKLVKKAHVGLGLDRCRGFFVAAAPIEVRILRYFSSIDIPIMEVFGQSECTGPHTANRLDGFRFGSVGRQLPGTETKIDSDNGELIYRGRHIFAGYKDMPDETKKTIDPEGWLHSGDVAAIDKGFVSITGRIKELIITAGGENVPPVLIEEELRHAMPALANCMVIGDRRKFLSVLLCLSVEIGDDGNATNKLTGASLDTSKEIGSEATTTDEARDCEKWKAYFDEGLKTANKKATSKAQNVQKWSLLSSDFTEPGGELTPTLKLKRSVTADKYNEAIEAMYA